MVEVLLAWRRTRVIDRNEHLVHYEIIPLLIRWLRRRDARIRVR